MPLAGGGEEAVLESSPKQFTLLLNFSLPVFTDSPEGQWTLERRWDTNPYKPPGIWDSECTKSHSCSHHFIPSSPHLSLLSCAVFGMKFNQFLSLSEQISLCFKKCPTASTYRLAHTSTLVCTHLYCSIKNTAYCIHAAKKKKRVLT